MARCSIDLPMISSPTRFITVSMRAGVHAQAVFRRRVSQPGSGARSA